MGPDSSAQAPEADQFDYSPGVELFERLFGPVLGPEFSAGGQYSGDTFRQVVWAGIGPSIWLRPKLDWPSKIKALIAMFAVMNKPELKLFILSAFINGVERWEVEEILLLAGLEAGMPAAAAGFRHLDEAEADYRAYLKRIGEG